MSQNAQSNIENEQIKKYLPLVYKICNRMNYGYVEMDDLIQAGMMGLHKALKKFNKDVSNNFIAFASIYIISEIKNELRNNKLILLNKKMLKIVKSLNTNKSIEEIAKENKTNCETVILAYDYQNKMISLDDINNDYEVPSKYRDHYLIDNLEKLPKLHKNILYDKYFNCLSQREIALKIGKSQSYVSRCEKKALECLRILIEDNK